MFIFLIRIYDKQRKDLTAHLASKVPCRLRLFSTKEPPTSVEKSLGLRENEPAKKPMIPFGSTPDESFFLSPPYDPYRVPTKVEIQSIRAHYEPYNSRDILQDKVLTKKKVTWGDWARLILHTPVNKKRELMDQIWRLHIDLVDDNSLFRVPLRLSHSRSPEQGGVKLNFKACMELYQDLGKVHLSAVVRDDELNLVGWDHEEHLLMGPTKSIGVGEFEMNAIGHGVRLMDKLGICDRVICIETDNAEAKAAVNSKFLSSKCSSFMKAWREVDALLKRFCLENRCTYEIFRITSAENQIANLIGRMYKSKNKVDKTTNLNDTDMRNYVDVGVRDAVHRDLHQSPRIIFPPKYKVE